MEFRIINTLLTLRRQYKDDTKYLFLNPECEDGKCHARSIDNYVRRVQVQLDFDTTKELRSTHDGRRTYATLQYLDGVDLKVIQRQLGHRTVKQTEDYIQDVLDTSRRAKELEQKGILDLSA